MKKLLLVILIAAALGAGCSTATQEVVVVTATPEPATVTPVSTETPAPTNTPTSTSTNTPQPTPTPDVRVIDGPPRSMILERTDLPEAGKFYLYTETPHRNSEVISGYGTEKGTKYLEASGRVDGWTIWYARGTRAARAPEFVGINVIVYLTPDGQSYTDIALGRCSENWVEISNPDPDAFAYVCEWRETQSSGIDYVVYEYVLSLRNLRAQVWGSGFRE